VVGRKDARDKKQEIRLSSAVNQILPIEQDFFLALAYNLLLLKLLGTFYFVLRTFYLVCLRFRISAATSLSPGSELASSC
jgi:hypothetical protein